MCLCVCVHARVTPAADDMGLFLQKTNIIRDYLEDLVEGRAFWVCCLHLHALRTRARLPVAYVCSAA